MSILINGDIYIKIKPSIFNPSKKDILKNELTKTKIKFYKECYGYNYILQKMEECTDFISKIDAKSGSNDYSYLTDFHVLTTNGYNVTMSVYKRLFNEKKDKSFKVDSSEFEKYKRFVDFLNDAEYVGKKIVSLPHMVVLYKTDYAACIQYTLFQNTKYIEMLDVRNLDMPLGEADKSVEKYRDKNLLFRKVVQEIEDVMREINDSNELGRSR